MKNLVFAAAVLFSLNSVASYKCTLQELSSEGSFERTHSIEFARRMSLTTDLAGPYQVEFERYTGNAFIKIYTIDGVSVLAEKIVNDGEPISVEVSDLKINCNQ
jgi:hypothetical protein